MIHVNYNNALKKIVKINYLCLLGMGHKKATKKKKKTLSHVVLNKPPLYTFIIMEDIVMIKVLKD